MEGNSRIWFLVGSLKASSATTLITCQWRPWLFPWWNRQSNGFVSIQICELGSGRTVAFVFKSVRSFPQFVVPSLFYKSNLLRGPIVNHLERNQEEMLESISAICKWTPCIKNEHFQGPHKLCVSLRNLQAYQESFNSTRSSYWFYSELIPEVMLYLNTQIYELNTLLIFSAQTDMK